MFKDHLGTNMEVYRDNMIIKTMLPINIFKDMEEVFGVIRKYGMKFNPKKCIVGATFNTFLRYLISAHRNEENPNKIQDLVSIKFPSNLKGIQQLNERIRNLIIFISKCTSKC